jgi:hypothetical protein
VEIVTAVGNPKTGINPDAEMVILGLKAEDIKILARTRIELDGDIRVLLPGDNNNEVSINREIMTIHKENVDPAVQNWNSFIHNMLSALDLLMSITGLSRSEVLTHFNLPVSSGTTASSSSSGPPAATSTLAPPTGGSSSSSESTST